MDGLIRRDSGSGTKLSGSGREDPDFIYVSSPEQDPDGPATENLVISV